MTTTAAHTKPATINGYFPDDPTVVAVYDMMTETVGKSMLDSGGAYGYNDARNKRKTIEDFLRMDNAHLHLDASNYHTPIGTGYVDMWVTVSLFHFLIRNLSYDEWMDAHLRAFITDEDAEAGDGWGARKSWHEISEEFAEMMNMDTDWRGNVREHTTINTYNGDSALDGIIEYRQFVAEGEDGMDHTYFSIQYHGGCDVRGGYTAPVIFRLDDDDDEEWVSEVPSDETFGLYCQNDKCDPDGNGYGGWAADFMHGEIYNREGSTNEEMERPNFIYDANAQERIAPGTGWLVTLAFHMCGAERSNSEMVYHNPIQPTEGNRKHADIMCPCCHTNSIAY
jgi:hypothetical protein